MPAAVDVLVVAGCFYQSEYEDRSHGEQDAQGQPDCTATIGFQDFLLLERSDRQGYDEN